MKTNKLTLALAAILTHSALGAMPAALPEFRNEQQLAEWRAEKAFKGAGEAKSLSYSYTGKPYLSSSGGYAFKYRSYQPEVARWAAEDPSGFPDGPNNNIYSPVPTIHVDPDGLSRRVVSKSVLPSDTDWLYGGMDQNSAGNIQYQYNYKIDYSDAWTQTTHGQTSAVGSALDFTINVGLHQSFTVSVGVNSGIQLGASVSQGGSVSQSLTFSQPATENVSWEGYVLSVHAKIYTRFRYRTEELIGEEWNDWGDWSVPQMAGQGVSGTFGQIIYKNIYE